MRTLIPTATSLFAALGILTAAPVIYPHQVLNAASYHAPGLPAGSIAQGSIFSIFGTGLGPAQPAQQGSFPLTPTFQGVSIQVTQKTTVVNAIPLYVANGQINALMPSNTPLGWVSLRVTFNNVKSNPSPVFIVRDSPGIFTLTGTGLGPAAIQNVVSATERPLNSNQASAKPGQVVVLYATGLGPISAPDVNQPPVGNVSTPVEVWVAGIPATIAYSGRSPCCSGLDEVDFVVPTNAPSGCWVPVYLRTSHSTVSNFTSIAIDPAGGACSDPSNSVASAIVSGGSLGLLSLNRIAIHEDVGVNAPVDIINDYVAFTATSNPSGPFGFVPFLSLPPPGACTSYQGIGDFLQSGSVPQASVRSLDGGKQLSIKGPSSQQSVTTVANASVLGSYLPLYSIPNRLVLAPGAYTVQTNGGADVPSFSASITVPGALNWSNRDQTTVINRAQPLTLNWSGAPEGQPVVIMGVGSLLPLNSSAVFVCVARAGATSFVVPPEVLAAMPASPPNPLSTKNVIFLMTSSPTPFSAQGLSVGLAAGGYIAGKTVTFQ